MPGMLFDHLHQRQDVSIVSPARVQPEHSLSSAGPRSSHRELHPVSYRGVLGLTQPPDISGLHAVLSQNLPSRRNHRDLARSRHLERLVVTAVLLRLLSHQPHIAGVAHRLPVKLPVLSGGVTISSALSDLSPTCSPPGQPGTWWSRTGQG